MTKEDIQTLAVYNAETARGISHTPEWVANMARLQIEFNRRGCKYCQTKTVYKELGMTCPHCGTHGYVVVD